MPALAFPLIAFFGKRMPAKGAEIGIVATAISFVMSLILAGHFIGGGGPAEAGFTWFRLGDGFTLQVSQYVDGLTSTMFVVVTLVSLCVQGYSTGYMKGDVRYPWYFPML